MDTLEMRDRLWQAVETLVSSAGPLRLRVAKACAAHLTGVVPDTGGAPPSVAQLLAIVHRDMGSTPAERRSGDLSAVTRPELDYAALAELIVAACQEMDDHATRQRATRPRCWC
jgi:hypothetical protein